MTSIIRSVFAACFFLLSVNIYAASVTYSISVDNLTGGPLSVKGDGGQVNNTSVPPGKSSIQFVIDNKDMASLMFYLQGGAATVQLPGGSHGGASVNMMCTGGPVCPSIMNFHGAETQNCFHDATQVCVINMTLINTSGSKGNLISGPVVPSNANNVGVGATMTSTPSR